MSPELALDLSHTGIALLRQAEDGWRKVGAVALDADTMAEDLAALRDEAGPDLRAKLVIPNTQILYTHCPATGRGELADEVRVRAALVGATPYDVADLVFDWQPDGETLHIAVVARETLAEARSFVREYGFAPIGFVAVPPRGTFQREPFFGPADEGPGAGRPMRPEDAPIHIVGDWKDRPQRKAAEPETEAVPVLAVAPETVESEAPLGEEPAPSTPAVADAGDGEPATPALQQLQAAPAEMTEPRAGAIPAGSEQPMPEEGGPGHPPEIEGAAPEPDDAPRGKSTPTPDHGSADPIASIVVEAAPSAGQDLAGDASPATEDSTTDDGAEPDGATVEAAVIAPAFTSIRTSGRDRGAPMVGAATSDGIAAPARKLGGARRDETPASPVRATSESPTPAGAPRNDTPGLPAVADEVDHLPPLPTASAARNVTRRRGPSAISALRDKLAARAEPPALTPEIIAAPLPRPDAAEVESVKAADTRRSREKHPNFNGFGPPAEQKSKRRIPLGLTGALVLLLAVLGLWSKLFLPDENTAGASAVAEQSFVSTTPVRGADGALTRSITFGQTGTSGATIDNQGEAELAEVLKAPQPAPEPEGAPLTTASLADDPFSALPETPGRIDEPMLEIPPLPEIDADPELAEEPEPAPATELTLEEARSAYDETGVWQRAPEATPAPQVDVTEDIYIASIDPGVTLHDAVALPRSESGGGTDTAIARQPSPPPAGQVVTFEPDGSIRPTAQGVVTAEGVTLFAGRPPVSPASRPDAAQEVPEAPVEAALPAPQPELAQTGRRPRARPQGLVEGNEKATLGGRTRAELAGLRPRVRPRSAQDAAETTRQAAIEEAVRASALEAANRQAQSDSAAEAERARAQAEVDSASKLAVASSRNPAARPRGFEARVAAARKQVETQPAPEAEAAPAAVVIPRNQRLAPPLPTSASVAKAATNSNALRLRQVNLIGVFGSPAQRRALVRLPSGRLVKVKVGDRVDGGQVAAIGDNELRYVKRGRNILLEMPKG